MHKTTVAQQDIELNLSLGSLWLDTWLGRWADCVLLSVLFHAVIVIMVLLMAVRHSQHTIRTSNVGVLAMILLSTVIFGVLRFNRSGSSNVAMSFYWQFGLIVAISGSLAASKDRKAMSRTTGISSKYIYRSQELIPS